MPGWIRADKAASAIAAEEVLRLKKTIEELQNKLDETQLSAPRGSEDLAQGEEIFPVSYKYEAIDQDFEAWEFDFTSAFAWNDIFESIGPLMLDEATDEKIRNGLNQMVRERLLHDDDYKEQREGYSNLRNFSINSHDEQTIKIQLRALGLIEQSKKARSVKDTRTFWSLTTYGDSVLVQLRAIPKGVYRIVERDLVANNDQADAECASMS